MFKFLGELVTFVFVVCVIGGGAAYYDLSSKAQLPSAAKCSGFETATLRDQLLMRGWMFSTSWTVHDLGFIRVAKTGHPDRTSKNDFMLVQIPFTNGSWYKL
jgi:hypothetical protein